MKARNSRAWFCSGFQEVSSELDVTVLITCWAAECILLGSDINNPPRLWRPTWIRGITCDTCGAWELESLRAGPTLDVGQ